MGHRVRVLGLMLGMLVGIAVPLVAQTRVDVGAFGGLAIPTAAGDADVELYKLGYTLGGTLRVHSEDWPIALQFDGQYMTFAREDANPYDGGLDLIGGTLSIVLALFPETSSFVPYLALGGGAYNLKSMNPRSLPDSLQYGSQVNAGVMLGGGFEYRSWKSRLVPYIDLRMVGIFGSDPRETAFITVTGGLKYVIGGEKPR